MGELKVNPIYLNLIYLQDCKYLKTTKLCTTSILTCFFCGDSFGAAFVNWTRWSSWYSSFLLVEWTCNTNVTRSARDILVTRDTDLGVGLAHRLVQGLVGVDGLLQHTDVVADLPHLAVTGPARHTLDVLKMENYFESFLGYNDVLKVLHFLLSDGRGQTAIGPCSSRQGRLQSSSKCYPGERLHFWKKNSKLKSSNCSWMSCSPDVTSSIVTSLD